MRRFSVSVFAILALASCSNDPEQETSGDSLAIHFGSGINMSTRAFAETSATFASGDKIQVIGAVDGAQLFNEEFIAGGDLVFATNAGVASTAFWKPGGVHNFYAYHPSHLEQVLNDTDVTGVKIDGVDAAIDADDEVLYAKLEEEFTYENRGKKTLAFDRKLAKVKFVVVKHDNYIGDDLTLDGISYTATLQKATMDVFTGELTLTGEDTPGENNRLFDVTNSATDKVVKTVTANDGAVWDGFTQLLVGGMEKGDTTLKDIVVTVSDSDIPVTGKVVDLQAGKITTITLTVTNAGITFDATIADWGELSDEGTIN